MASPKFAQWTVVIVMEENPSLTGTFQLLPSTRLSHLMEMWKEQLNLVFGNWIFLSANSDITFHDEKTTLEMVGETAPRMVYLRAVLANESISEIFAYQNDDCHHISVKPTDTLGDVLWGLPGKPKFLEYNGLPLNVYQTVQQAGLRNKSVIYEPLCSITVKLSTKESIVIQMPSNCLVFHLKEKVSFYETGDFSLRYQGRYLKSSETVAQLKYGVEVTQTEFVVNFNNRCVSWITNDEPISFSEFITQLSVKGDIDTQLLETSVFICVGCQRRICHSEDFVQQLPIECCKEKSQTLNAMQISDTGAVHEFIDVTTHILNFQKHLVECKRQNSRAESSRRVSRKMKKKFSAERLNYNIITECSETFQISINELEYRIKELEADIKTLKIRNFELEEENGRMQSTIMKRNDEETEMLKEDCKRSGDHTKEKPKKKTPLLLLRKLSSRGESTFGGELGVKLLVHYNAGAFSLASKSKVSHCGEYSWSGSYIKCQIPKIPVGTIAFKDLRAVLQRLFTGREIRVIRQCRGSVAGNEVAEVTSQDEDEAARPDMSPYMNHSPYCDIEGSEHTWEEAERPRLRFIRAGGHAILCGGGRRTILTIDWK